MKIHRFIGNFNIKPGGFILTDGEIVHQIWDVLKLRPDEKILLCDGQLNEGLARIIENTKNGLEVEIENISVNNSEPANRVSLYCAILKKENFELVCQKATEAGVAEIIPVITDRTVKLNLRYDRLEKIIREAAEQSGRGHVPVLEKATGLAEALEHSQKYNYRIWLDASGSPMSHPAGDAAVFIGPEGGWTEAEISTAKESGLQVATLGSLILRAETAAIIATYLVCH